MQGSTLLNYNSAASVRKAQEKLYNTWGFSKQDIDTVLEKYRYNGCVALFGDVHYKILSDLLNLHMENLDTHEQKEAYLVSKKANMLAFYSPNGIKEAGAFSGGLVTLFVSNFVENGKAAGIVAAVFFVLWGLFVSHSTYLMSSPGRQFYQDFFSNMEKRYLAG